MNNFKCRICGSEDYDTLTAREMMYGLNKTSDGDQACFILKKMGKV